MTIGTVQALLYIAAIVVFFVAYFKIEAVVPPVGGRLIILGFSLFAVAGLLSLAS